MAWDRHAIARTPCVWDSFWESGLEALPRAPTITTRYRQWLVRWSVFARLVRLGYNVLCVDADAVLVLDPVFIQEPVDIVPRRSTAPSGVSRPSVRAQRRRAPVTLGASVDAARERLLVHRQRASTRPRARGRSHDIRERQRARGGVFVDDRDVSTLVFDDAAAIRRDDETRVVPRLGLVLVADAIHRRRGVE